MKPRNCLKCQINSTKLKNFCFKKSKEKVLR